jgi:hypothetical protein
MNFKATVKGIAASGGIRPDSHITACPVTAIKAGPVAHYLGRVPCCHRMVVGSDKLAMRQPCLTLTGQRSYTDARERPSKRFGLMQGSRRATSRSGGGYGLWPATAFQQTSPHYRRNLGNPCAEKVRPHRARQNNVSEPALVAGVGDHWQGTLTITGSNVRLGTEMPVALSSFL